MCSRSHDESSGELAFPLAPLLETARTTATKCLSTLTQSTSSTYVYPQNPTCGRTTWNFLDSLFCINDIAASFTIKFISLKLLEISSYCVFPSLQTDPIIVIDNFTRESIWNKIDL